MYLMMKTSLKSTRAGGRRFWYKNNDRYVGQRIALGKYEPYLSELIAEKADSSRIAIDVGANIGYYTVLLAKKVKKVYAIEPEKESYEILRKNTRGMTGVVTIMAAASDKKGAGKLAVSEENFGDHRLVTEGTGKAVKTITLDELAEEERVGLIKIDTQGWEPKVIEGAKKIISRDRPVIFLEYSPTRYEETGNDGDRMIEFLKEIYGQIWVIDEWLYTYTRLGKDRKKAINPKTGYADLWMGAKEGWVERIKRVRVKKLIKRIAGMDWRK